MLAADEKTNTMDVCGLEGLIQPEAIEEAIEYRAELASMKKTPTLGAVTPTTTEVRKLQLLAVVVSVYAVQL